MEPVRWGIMSVSGHYALRIHHPLSHLGEACIVAIASRGRDRAAEAATRFGIAKSHGSYAELVADPEVEAVYMPLPTTSTPNGRWPPSTPASTSFARSH
jgi:predicted dehydrogenase